MKIGSSSPSRKEYSDDSGKKPDTNSAHRFGWRSNNGRAFQLGQAILARRDSVLSGYKLTGDFETELRYFIEITGRRRNSKQLFENLRSDLIAQNPQNAEKINQLVNTALEAGPTFDETVAAEVPIYAKYYSVAEIHSIGSIRLKLCNNT